MDAKDVSVSAAASIASQPEQEQRRIKQEDEQQ
jgi:hypothetical protein